MVEVMTIYTNNSQFGGAFGNKITSLLQEAESIIFASGYISKDVLLQYNQDFIRIAENGGDFTLLVGMAFFEGLRQSTYNQLLELNEAVLSANPNCNGVMVVYSPPAFHGKIYSFKHNDESLYFAGSSNFSKNGFFDNLEFTCQITEREVIQQTEAFLNWLVNEKNAVNIAKCQDFPIVEKVQKSYRNFSQKAKSNTSLQVSIGDETPHLDISLSRVDQQTRSNLNVFMGKGRLKRTTGIVTPINWFEVEIIVDTPTTKNHFYPQGDFTVTTDDGLTFPCSTQGDNYKNFRSKDDLKVLGYWLKGKLLNKGSIRMFEIVTSQTLQDYGKDYLRLYKLSDTNYYLEF